MKGKLIAALGVAGLLALTACTTQAAKFAPAPQNTKQETRSHDATRLAAMADDVVGRVVSSMGPMAETGLVAIATPVDVSSLEQTDWLGRELAEQFVNALHKRGIPVYEYKIKGWLEVTKEGDYIYSRNWQKLATKANVSRVLSGTLSRNDTGVMLYSRLVNLKTQVVEGSAELFIPYDVLPKCYRVGASACGGNTGLSTLYPAATSVAPANAANVNSSRVNTYTNQSPSVKPITPSSKPVANRNARNNAKNSSTVANAKNGVQASNAQKTSARATGNRNISSVSSSGRNAVNQSVASRNNGQMASYQASMQNNNASSGKTGEPACTACAKGSGTVSKCHKDCYEAVTYPASTVGVGGLLVRDASGQSQYDRK